jgi:hypothetical protein
MQMKMAEGDGQEVQTCELRDFYLCAFLICSGLELIRTDPAGNDRMIFVLRESPERSRLTEAYYGHRASADPLAFKDVIVNLKSIIHGRKAIR